MPESPEILVQATSGRRFHLTSNGVVFMPVIFSYSALARSAELGKRFSNPACLSATDSGA